MSTAGGGLKVGCSAWLGLKGLSTLDLVRQRASSLSRVADAIWGQFFFPPVAGPLSSNPTWIPNWVPLQVALQMPSIKLIGTQFNKGSTYANRTWFTTLATNEASGNAVWAKFRAGTNRVVVQLKMVPGYYQPLALNRD